MKGGNVESSDGKRFTGPKRRGSVKKFLIKEGKHTITEGKLGRILNGKRKKRDARYPRWRSTVSGNALPAW